MMKRVVAVAFVGVMAVFLAGTSCSAAVELTAEHAQGVRGGCLFVCEDWTCPLGHEADDPCEDNIANCGCFTSWESVSRVAGPDGDSLSRSSCCGPCYDCDLEVTVDHKFKCVKKENYCGEGICEDPLIPDVVFDTGYLKCYKGEE